MRRDLAVVVALTCFLASGAHAARAQNPPGAWNEETLGAAFSAATSRLHGGRRMSERTSLSLFAERRAAADALLDAGSALDLAWPSATTACSWSDRFRAGGPDGTVWAQLQYDDGSGTALYYGVPPGIAGATWTCTGFGGGACAPSGSGDVAQSVDLPVGGSVVFTLAAAVDPASTAVLVNTASAALPAGLSELSPADNSATDITSLDACQLGALTVTGVTYSAGHMLASETSITTEGEVVVATGADVLFRAPVLAFGSGFRVESGAHFEALAEAVECSEGSE